MGKEGVGSAALEMTLFPLQFRDLEALEPHPHSTPPPPHSLHASSCPTPHSVSWDSSYHRPLPKATHRMWSAMDLPLLRNIYSVLFAKYESESLTMGLTRGWDCWGGSPPSALPGTPPYQPAYFSLKPPWCEMACLRKVPSTKLAGRDTG